MSVNGLSFADVIFIDDFSDPFAGITEYKVIVDKEYTTPTFLAETTIGVIASTISPALAGQLDVISNESSDRIDLTAKLYYKTLYKDGSWCDANNEPRNTKVVYMCD